MKKVLLRVVEIAKVVFPHPVKIGKAILQPSRSHRLQQRKKPAILLENGFSFLLENGNRLLMEKDGTKAFDSPSPETSLPGNSVNSLHE